MSVQAPKSKREAMDTAVANKSMPELVKLIEDKNQPAALKAAARRKLKRQSEADKTPGPRMAKGGYANCGASSPATQASTKKMNQGGLLTPDNPGLKKLPKPVRNKMGYMASGGYAKKK